MSSEQRVVTPKCPDTTDSLFRSPYPWRGFSVKEPITLGRQCGKVLPLSTWGCSTVSRGTGTVVGHATGLQYRVVFD